MSIKVLFDAIVRYYMTHNTFFLNGMAKINLLAEPKIATGKWKWQVPEDKIISGSKKNILLDMFFQPGLITIDSCEYELTLSFSIKQSRPFVRVRMYFSLNSFLARAQ